VPCCATGACARGPNGSGICTPWPGWGGSWSASIPLDCSAENCWPFCASSTTWKKLASSAMLPSRFQLSPVRLISSSRDTFRSTIHFWSVVSSLKVKTLPLAWRTFQSFVRSGARSGLGSGFSAAGAELASGGAMGGEA
jgi:hypothetical protein